MPLCLLCLQHALQPRSCPTKPENPFTPSSLIFYLSSLTPLPIPRLAALKSIFILMCTSSGTYPCKPRFGNYWATLHYITLSSFQTPLSPKVTSGASTITCYTKYCPPAITQASYSAMHGKYTTQKENQLHSGTNCSSTHNIISRGTTQTRPNKSII